MINIQSLSVFLIILCLFTCSSYASTDLNTIQEKLSYVDNHPFAVRYSIVDKDVYNNNQRKAYYNGDFDDYSKEDKLEVARQYGNSILKDGCIYISDGQGQQRFQYTQHHEPIDINLYPYLIKTYKGYGGVPCGDSTIPRVCRIPAKRKGAEKGVLVLHTRHTRFTTYYRKEKNIFLIPIIFDIPP